MLGVGLSLFLLSSDYQKSFLLENLSSTRCDPWQWDHPTTHDGVFDQKKVCDWLWTSAWIPWSDSCAFLSFHSKNKWIHIEVKYWVGLDTARRRWQGGEGGTKAEVDPPWFISFSQLCFSSRPQPNIMGAKPDSSLEKWCCSKQTNTQVTEKCSHLLLSLSLFCCIDCFHKQPSDALVCCWMFVWWLRRKRHEQRMAIEHLKSRLQDAARKSAPSFNFHFSSVQWHDGLRAAAFWIRRGQVARQATRKWGKTIRLPADIGHFGG